MFDRSLIKIGSTTYSVQQTESELVVDGDMFIIPEFTLIDRLVRVRINDRYEEFVVNRNGDELWLHYRGRTFPLEIETERERLLNVASSHTDVGHSGALVKAQMPGLVARVSVSVGDKVKRSDPVVVLEAMKMENEIRVPVDGVVKEIRVKERDSVEKGAVLLVLE